MLPQNAISSPAYPADFLLPDATDYALPESLEEGGIALNDASHGRQYQTWRAWISGHSIKCAPLVSGTPETVLVSGAGVLTTISIAFDSAMQPTICYLDDGVLKLRWFNTVSHTFQTDTYAGATFGKVSTDDKRSTQEGASDVIFAYCIAGYLYWRQQRDRYTVERLVGPSGTKIINRMGLTKNNRFEFELAEP